MNFRPLWLPGLAFALAVVAGGCGDPHRERLEGARRALAAVPDLEILGADAASGILTVRSRSTRAISVINVEAGTDASPAPAPAPAPVEHAAPPPATPASTANGRPSEAEQSPASSTAADAGVTAPTAPVVTRDRSGGVARIEGPGFSVERLAPGKAGGAAGTARSATSSATPAELVRSDRAIVCAAGETKSVENIDINVPGAAIVARRGCQLQLSHVQVHAGGWGLVIEQGAEVRMDDSVIQGRTGALDLEPGGSLSAWASAFQGALSRPLQGPEFVDRGGNTFQ
jgi:hypothetical protein